MPGWTVCLFQMLLDSAKFSLKSLSDIYFFLYPLNKSDKINKSWNVKVCSPSVWPFRFCSYSSLRPKVSLRDGGVG